MFVVTFILTVGKPANLLTGIFYALLSPYGGFAPVWSVNAPTATSGVRQRAGEAAFLFALSKQKIFIDFVRKNY